MSYPPGYNQGQGYNQPQYIHGGNEMVVVQAGPGVQPAYNNGQQPQIIMVQQQSTDLGMLFFIFGFLVPILWLVGSCVPSGDNLSRSARQWRNANRVMATVACGCYIFVIILNVSARSTAASSSTSANRNANGN
jgi:hypothetical protein